MTMLLPQLPLHETLLRASVVYLAVCVLMRVIPKRQAGGISPQDLVGVVIVGGLAVAGITSSKAGPADNLLMIGVVLFWNLALNWLSDRYPKFRRIFREPPTCLIRNGRFLKEAMRREMVTEEELLAELRKQGISDVSQVRKSYLEADGQISVVKAKQVQADRPAPGE